ncbi:hypothetical protein AGLY_016042 [Aphis glycines]|uniref:Uncharacterized protein n=1 Tax=Aphis glycines TaxID=307491 RepID=A0A6G0SYL3_APHGL|nr:hypothetical protein AGLY_016042 [Aphis glycines]
MRKLQYLFQIVYKDPANINDTPTPSITWVQALPNNFLRDVQALGCLNTNALSFQPPIESFTAILNSNYKEINFSSTCKESSNWTKFVKFPLISVVLADFLLSNGIAVQRVSPNERVMGHGFMELSPFRAQFWLPTVVTDSIIVPHSNMWQTSWDEIPITNKFKSIKKKITKWYTQPNASRRSEIINTRTRIGHTNLTHIHIIKYENNLSVANITNRFQSNILPAICQRKKHTQPTINDGGSSKRSQHALDSYLLQIHRHRHKNLI